MLSVKTRQFQNRQSQIWNEKSSVFRPASPMHKKSQPRNRLIIKAGFLSFRSIDRPKWRWRGMNLLQVPLDIQLVSKFQSLSVAYTARFSQRKDKQFPSHTTIFSSKKYQTSHPDITQKSLGSRRLSTRSQWDLIQCPAHLGHLIRCPLPCPSAWTDCPYSGHSL